MNETEKLTKKDIGKKLWLIPDGNEVVRGVKGGALSQLITAELCSIARVNGAFKDCASGKLTDFRISVRGRLFFHTGFNGGYYVFLSNEEFQHYKTARELRLKISDGINAFSDRNIISAAKALGLEFDL